jgi:PAS domain S-box-containing protein
MAAEKKDQVWTKRLSEQDAAGGLRDGDVTAPDQRFRSIFESANAGMNTVDGEGRFLEVNPAFCRFVGYSSEELSACTVFDLTHPDDLPETRRRFGEIHSGLRRAFNYEKRFVRSDGLAVWGHVTSAWLFDSHERPLYGVGLVQDITARKRAEERLCRALVATRQARDRIGAILEAVGQGLIVTDQRGRVMHLSPSAERLLGVRQSSAVPQYLPELFSDGRVAQRVAAVMHNPEEQNSFEFDLAGNHGNPPRTIQARVSVMRDAAMVLQGFILVLHDVTREREVDRMKTEFISTAAHELRTPLTSIQGFSEILLSREGWRAEERRDMLQAIHAQAQILSMVVTDLLDVARIESGAGFVLNRRDCRLTDLVQQAIFHVPHRSGWHRFEIDIAGDAATVHCDMVKMRQILENLLSNAIKYSPAGGSVKIAARRDGEEILLSVQDQGIGMAPEQVQRVFDKFYRADVSNSAIEGVGLGMSIVREIVHAHGWRIWIESMPGRGTTVFLSLCGS